MVYTDLIANELGNSGFKVRILELKFKSIGMLEAVEVSLGNRRASHSEVRQVLNDKFEGIEFNLYYSFGGIMVTE